MEESPVPHFYSTSYNCQLLMLIADVLFEASTIHYFWLHFISLGLYSDSVEQLTTKDWILLTALFTFMQLPSNFFTFIKVRGPIFFKLQYLS